MFDFTLVLAYIATKYAKVKQYIKRKYEEAKAYVSLNPDAVTTPVTEYHLFGHFTKFDEFNNRLNRKRFIFGIIVSMMFNLHFLGLLVIKDKNIRAYIMDFESNLFGQAKVFFLLGVSGSMTAAVSYLVCYYLLDETLVQFALRPFTEVTIEQVMRDYRLDRRSALKYLRFYRISMLTTNINTWSTIIVSCTFYILGPMVFLEWLNYIPSFLVWSIVVCSSLYSFLPVLILMSMLNITTSYLIILRFKVIITKLKSLLDRKLSKIGIIRNSRLIMEQLHNYNNACLDFYKLDQFWSLVNGFFSLGTASLSFFFLFILFFIPQPWPFTILLSIMIAVPLLNVWSIPSLWAAQANKAVCTLTLF